MSLFKWYNRISLFPDNRCVHLRLSQPEKFSFICSPSSFFHLRDRKMQISACSEEAQVLGSTVRLLSPGCFGALFSEGAAAMQFDCPIPLHQLRWKAVSIRSYGAEVVKLLRVPCFMGYHTFSFYVAYHTPSAIESSHLVNQPISSKFGILLSTVWCAPRKWYVTPFRLRSMGFCSDKSGAHGVLHDHCLDSNDTAQWLTSLPALMIDKLLSVKSGTLLFIPLKESQHPARISPGFWSRDHDYQFLYELHHLILFILFWTLQIPGAQISQWWRTRIRQCQRLRSREQGSLPQE